MSEYIQAPATPAGWYPDGSGMERYWDGNDWTDQVSTTLEHVPAEHVPAEQARVEDALPTTFQAASGGDRFLARFIDALMFIPLIPIFVFIPIFGPILFTLLLIMYNMGAEMIFGRTVGKAVMSTRVVRAGGAKPSIGSAIVRNLWMIFGLIPYVGSFISLFCFVVLAISVLASSRGRGLHDSVARSFVVKTSKNVTV